MELKLERLVNYKKNRGPVLLAILDGVGIGKHDDGDAVYMAKTPTLDDLFKNCKLQTSLKAHGPAVGLPTDDDMGNSEVGHNAIGAGRIFEQGAKLVNKSLASGDIFKSDSWLKISEKGQNGGTVHFIGLFSDGNVHSNISQLEQMIKKCAEQKIENVRLHILLDGRDVGAKTALQYIRPMEELLSKISSENNFSYKIASGGGRMITTMDRYNADWSIVERGWKAHVLGEARKFKSAEEAVQTMYDEDEKATDQYLESFVIVDSDNNPVGKIVDGDAAIFFNFRGDRAIEISRAFDDKDFKFFDRKFYPEIFYAGMMEYDGDLHIPKNYLVQPPAIDRTVSHYLCSAGEKSFAISETQKFGHVTYFWNGNKSGYINEDLEKYVEIPSDNIPFDQKPKMKAIEITDKTIEFLNSGKFSWGRINIANGDMVGHTGSMTAAIEAMETVDNCVSRLRETVKALGGVLIVTADHGNADEMFTVKNGVKSVKTSHTLNPVPIFIEDFSGEERYELAEIEEKGLANIASTLLNLLGYQKVEDYEPSLLKIK